MDLRKYTEKLSQIEEQITQSIDLLEIAKSYCDYNFDKGGEISALGSILEVILKEQRQVANCLDNLS